jgi:hypothetical protein
MNPRDFGAAIPGVTGPYRYDRLSEKGAECF